MRLIGSLDNETHAHHFSAFLSEMGIPNQSEVAPNFDWGSPDYGQVSYKIWIIDEDQVEAAQEWFSSFQKNPKDPFFAQRSPKQQKKSDSESFRKKGPKIVFGSFKNGFSNSRNKQKVIPTPVTNYIILACIFFFFWTTVTAPPSQPIPANIPYVAVTASPLEKGMLYDYPKAYEMADKLLYLYGGHKLQDPAELPKEGRILYQQYLETPYWKGGYELLIGFLTNRLDEKQLHAPLFEKIDQGQIWRVLSPAFLHYDIFHIFFNMLWLLVLGKQIESRIGKKRYILLMLLAGIVSNTSQYLMSGPNFLGYSGILCGMAAFIWMRQRLAVWEGYQVDRTSIVFLGLFVMIMFGVQLLSFFAELLFQFPIAPGIANTAHLSGAAVGALLARFKYFAS
jgi:GlpG protein